MEKHYTLSVRKTRTVEVVSVKSEKGLGEIRWYAPWRQYVFYPLTQTLFNPGCMEQIANYTRAMTAKHFRELRLRKDEVAQDAD
jgi:hypothetical protein